jgi:hypothetical protein
LFQHSGISSFERVSVLVSVEFMEGRSNRGWSEDRFEGGPANTSLAAHPLPPLGFVFCQCRLRAFFTGVKFFVLTFSPGSQLFHGINRSLTRILIP